MTATKELLGGLVAISGIGRVLDALIDLIKPLGEDAPKAMIRVMVERFGPSLVRGEVDQYELGRVATDALEDLKFGRKP